MKLRRLPTIALVLSLAACVEPVRSGSGSSGGGTSSGGGSSGGTSSGGGSSGGTSSGGTSSGGTSSGGTSSGGTSSGGTSSGGSPCPAGNTGGHTLSIDAGGPAVGTFRADAFHAGGDTFTTTAEIDTSGIACDAPPAAVFQSERYGEFTYTIPNRTPGTAQTVTLYFQESFWTESGKRTFDVAVDGKTVLAAFDIHAAAGGARRAIARSLTTTAAADGRVVIRFVRTGPDNPKVCGITITGEGSDPASGGGACPAAGTLTPGDSRRTLTVDGAVRSYVLHVPQGYTGTEPVPLLLDFHGYGGDGAAQQAISGFSQQSDQHGFVVAFPDAIAGCWNPGVPGLSCGNDDLGFARALVRELSELACIDAARVYASGFSQGGGMVYYVACKAADVFAAGAPSAFDLGFDCAPSRPISILSFRGTADRYDGSGNALIGAPRTLERWKELDGCTGATTDWMGCAVYQTCSGGTEAGLCSIQGGGHGPGSAETGWAFLSRHALP